MKFLLSTSSLLFLSVSLPFYVQADLLKRTCNAKAQGYTQGVENKAYGLAGQGHGGWGQGGASAGDGQQGRETASTQLSQGPIGTESTQNVDKPSATEQSVPSSSAPVLESSVPSASASGSDESSGNNGSSSSASGGGKGLLWTGDTDNTDGVGSVGGSVSWYWNWDASPTTGIPDNVAFVPQLWDIKKHDPATFVDTILAMKPLPEFILGPNECDLSEQCDDTAENIANAYKGHLAQLRTKGIKIGSPAVAADKTWLSDFFDYCGSDCPVDFVSVHTYMNYDDKPLAMQNLVQSYIDSYPDMDIWVTEFALQASSNPTDAETKSYMQEMETWFNDHVARYSWFATGFIEDGGYVSPTCSLLDASGSLTELGNVYFS